MKEGAMRKNKGELKKFLLKGNVMDLAVAVVIGGAFGKIVTSLVNDIIMPTVGLLMGGISFADLKILITPASEGVEEVAIRYGMFIQSVIDFLIIGITIFFIIKLFTKFQKKKEEEPAAPPKSTNEEILLTEIRDLLKTK
jgi:large conductance mechanosensitive channel